MTQRIQQSVLTGLTLVVLSIVAVEPAAAQFEHTQTGVNQFELALFAMVLVALFSSILLLFDFRVAAAVTDLIRESPIKSFAFGFLSTLFIAPFVFALMSSPLGFLILLPFAVILLLISVLGFLAAGKIVHDSWGVAFLVAVMLGGFVGGVPLFGGIAGAILWMFSIGGFVQYWYQDGEESASGRRSTYL